MGVALTANRWVVLTALVLVLSQTSHSYADDWQTLQSVQHRVNSGILYDRSAASPPSKFKVWPKVGACGDFSKTKAHELKSAGFTPDRMKIVLCHTWDGQYHAYLLVDGGWALDNRFSHVVRARDVDCE